MITKRRGAIATGALLAGTGVMSWISPGGAAHGGRRVGPGQALAGADCMERFCWRVLEGAL